MDSNSNSNSKDKYIFLTDRHIKFFKRCLSILPYSSVTYDTSRLTVLFFTLSGLDLLKALDTLSADEKSKLVEWIYSLQVISPKYDANDGGFRGGNSLNSLSDNSEIATLNCGHIAMTYCALASLVILGDDLSRVNRKAIARHIKSLQCNDGSFFSTSGGSENDMRFVYCASVVCYILQDFTALNVESAVKYILKSVTFEGGIGQGPSRESHGGSTFCGVAALYLMDRLDSLTHHQKENLVRWLVMRQDTIEKGLQGRPNKKADTCYTFWVGASLKLLDKFHLLDQKNLLNFVLSTQDPITGGLGKYVDTPPDGLHSYLGISGLSLMETDECGLNLNSVEAALNISKRASSFLKNLHQNWSKKS